MAMIKQNVAEPGRTPAKELRRKDADWDKEAAAEFRPVKNTPKVKRPAGR